MRWALLATALLLAGAGAATSTLLQAGPPDAGDVSPSDALPPVDGAPPVLEAPVPRRPLLLGTYAKLGEPAVAVGPGGAVYAMTVPNVLWRSLDGGATFEPVGRPYCNLDFQAKGAPRPPDPPACPPGFEAHDAGLAGTGDVDVVALPDGSVHFAGLWSPSRATLRLPGQYDLGVPYQRSADQGATWSEPVELMGGDGADRQWLVADGRGRLHLTHRDGSDALWYRRSTDGGATWSDARAFWKDVKAGAPAVHPATGEVVVPVADARVSVLVGDPLGGNVTRHDVSGPMRTRAEVPAALRGPFDAHYGFPVVAFDRAGIAYLAFATDDLEGPAALKDAAVPRVFLAVSRDGARTWSTPAPVSAPGHAAVFPALVAGEEGRVALAWYENRHGLPSEVVPDLWDVRLVESVDAAAPEPTFAGTLLNEAPIHLGGVCTQGTTPCTGPHRDRTLLDLFEVALGEDGHPVVAWIADHALKGVRVEVWFGGVAEGTPLA